MLRNLFGDSGDIPFAPEPGEQIVGQYKTYGYGVRNKPGGDAGALIVTSQRLVFFRRENVVKKIIQSIKGKQEAPSYKPGFSIYLGQVFKVKKGSANGHKYILINGTAYYLENADPKTLVKILKTAMKSGSLMKPGQQPPASVPLINQIAQPAVQQAPAAIPQAGGRMCTYCGIENKVDSQFCKSCGARLQ